MIYSKVFCQILTLLILLLPTLVPAQTEGISKLVQGDSPLRQNEVIAFLGASIVEEGGKPGGFCRLIADAIEQNRPDLNATFVFAGISGNKVPDLQQRLERDVLSKSPTLVFIHIGINDVWHSNSGNGTPKEKYEAGLREVIEKITRTNAKVVLCTPNSIGEKSAGSNPLDPMLDEYAAISRSVAQETGATLCDLRNQFVEHLEQNNPDNKEAGILTRDGVHFNEAGNAFVAEAAAEAIAEALKSSTTK